MELLDVRLIAAWQLASEDLGFRFVSPFLTADRNGAQLSLEGHLPDFGGPEGMAIVSFERRLKLGVIGTPMSILPKESRKYVRKHVIAELSDWGWSGLGAPPPWLNVR